MKTLFLFTTAAFLCAAQDDRVKFNTDAVRVLKVSNTAGQKSRRHKHDINRIMIHLDAGHMVLTFDDGPRDIRFKPGDVRWDPAGGFHTSENAGKGPYTIVEVELKHPKGKPVQFPKLDPLKVAPKNYKVEIDNDQVRVVRAKLAPGESIPMHEHAIPRVVVFLTDFHVRVTTSDGKTSETNAKAGDVAMPGPSVHSEVNIGGKPAEIIAVELK